MMSRIVLAVFVVLVANGVRAASTLPQLNVDKSQIAVGGLSAGAFFAVQMHVAYSSEISGAAIFAGGPYDCAKDSEIAALTTCMTALPFGPDVSELVSKTKSAASDGKIDDLSNLQGSHVFLYSGAMDTVVHPKVVQSLETYYRDVLGSNANITTEYSIQSQHCIPTVSSGNACSQLGSPYICNCNYDGAQHALETVFGSLGAKGEQKSENLIEFDQTKYGDMDSISMNDKGYVYVPSACKSGNTECRMFVNFHGCQQTLSNIGTKYMTETGFNDWAESNNIVILYPQVKAELPQKNPGGCFDWWGYNTDKYLYKDGDQMKVVKAMMDSITG